MYCVGVGGRPFGGIHGSRNGGGEDGQFRAQPHFAVRSYASDKPPLESNNVRLMAPTNPSIPPMITLLAMAVVLLANGLSLGRILLASSSSLRSTPGASKAPPTSFLPVVPQKHLVLRTSPGSRTTAMERKWDLASTLPQRRKRCVSVLHLHAACMHMHHICTCILHYMHIYYL